MFKIVDFDFGPWRAFAPAMESSTPTVANDGVVVDLAGLPVLLTSIDHEWLHYVRRRFAAFIIDETPVFKVIHNTRGSRPTDLSSPMMTRIEERKVVSNDCGFDIRSETFTASGDHENRLVEVTGPCALYPLDAVLRHWLPILLSNGLLLHAGAAAENGAGVVFCGPSGAGKSTMGTLLGGRTLCDEMAAVVVEDRSVVVRATPFWRAKPGQGALRGIFVLSHGEDNHQRRRLTPVQALRELQGHVLWPLHHGEAVDRCFATLAAIVEQTPVWSLAFLPREDVWQVMTRGGSP